MSAAYFDASIEKLLSMLKGVEIATNDNNARPVSKDNRLGNTYFTNDDKKEIKRLKIQQNLLKNFDGSVYKEAIDSFETLRVLDIGSNNGAFVMDRIGSSSKLEKLVGLEYDEGAVNEANQKYGKGNRYGYSRRLNPRRVLPYGSLHRSFLPKQRKFEAEMLQRGMKINADW
jgi:hypothetical protein